jgi:hypothetical protein
MEFDSLLQRLYALEVYHEENDDHIEMCGYLFCDVGFNVSEFKSFIENEIDPKLYKIFESVKEEDSKFFIFMVFTLDYIHKLLGYDGKFCESELPIGDVQFLLFQAGHVVFPYELANNVDFINMMNDLYDMNL